jgi:hypothetical protein
VYPADRNPVSQAGIRLGLVESCLQASDLRAEVAVF